MPGILTAILALLAQAPTAITEVMALWNAVKGGVSATDAAQIDAILAILNPKTDADLAKLASDAAAQGA